MFCENCWANIADNSKFCPICGSVITNPSQQPLGVHSEQQVGIQSELHDGMQSEQHDGMQSEQQAEAKIGYQPELQSGVQIGFQPGVQPEFQTGYQPEIQPGLQTGYQTGTQSGVQTGYQPGVQPEFQTGAQYPNQQPPIMQQPLHLPGKKQSPIMLISVIIAIAIVLGGIGITLLILQRNSGTPISLFGNNKSASNNAALDNDGKDEDASLPFINFTTTAEASESQEETTNDSSEINTTGAHSSIEETTTAAATAAATTKSEATTAQTLNNSEIVLPYVSYTYENKKPEAVIEFTTIDSVFPSNYRTLDSLVVFTGYCDYGELEILIDVEVPGFTQPYRQKVKIGRQVTKLRIVPPLITGSLDLNSEKIAQLVYSVTEVESGKLLIQESKNIKLYSKFDIIWGDQSNWDAFTDNILAWMTPDAPEITSLKRDAIDYLSLITDGALEGIYGYQDYHYFEHVYGNTWAQAVAIQGAMSDIIQVRYNNSWFSMDAQQRVKLPVDTLSSRSGLCIETSLVMASALESSGMHVMLLFPPGHAQVAVEAWPDTGDYFLIETTSLPMARDAATWERVVRLLTKEEWRGYISGEGDITLGPCYVVDCDLGEKLGIRAISN